MATATSELREMGDDELLTKLVEARQELFNLRFQLVTGQLDNYARLGDVRKEIARVNTLLREREIAAAEAEAEDTPAADETGADATGADETTAAADARRARVLGSRRAARAARAQEENE